jgi:cyclic pyranopterin phosphate synthase
MNREDRFRPPVLKDAFQRRIDYLRISITDQCNLKCVYCMPAKGLKALQASDLLTVREITRIVQAAHRHGLKNVRITGGEPLLRRDIVTLIAGIKKHAGIHDLSLTTNGIMLADMARTLRKAGLDRVNISLDTMDPERYRAITRGGNIRHVWEAIEQAEDAGLLPVKLNVVPLRGMNDDEIEAFARLTIERDYHVRFIEYMPMNGHAWKRELCVPTEELMKRIAVLGTLSPLEFKGGGPSRNYRIEGARGVIGFISPLTDHFCGWCNRIRLTATGKMRPCLFSGVEVDLKTPLRTGVSQEELGRLIGCAVAAKPGGHGLRARDQRLARCASMSRIGG